MSNDVLLPILYAGLAGTLLALIVATATQRWSLRVFFLLALRLAIGWHFLFEGLHKLHSYYMGPAETNRVFSSEVYFKVSPGPLGPYMRKQFTDTDAVFAARLKPTEIISAADFAQMPADMQAAACPDPIAKQLEDIFTKDLEAALKKIDEEDKKHQADANSDAVKAYWKDRDDKAREELNAKFEAMKADAAVRTLEAKRKYALWVYGVEGRDCKIKGISGTDASLTAPQRLAHLDFLRKRVRDADEKLKSGMGNGFGIEQKRAAEFRTDVVAAETELLRDIDAFVAELEKEMLAGKTPEPVVKETSRGQMMDRFTMWFIAIVGACLMGGLFTRIACLAGTGFLVLTYLTHPPFPWFPLPPTTEGNPVFINKNVIEALALLAIATFPTGRWLGLDALLGRICPCGRNKTTTI
jgi:uncharacterized membrane protein YphA (DoxX/SURF4 family)